MNAPYLTLFYVFMILDSVKSASGMAATDLYSVGRVPAEVLQFAEVAVPIKSLADGAPVEKSQ